MLDATALFELGMDQDPPANDRAGTVVPLPGCAPRAHAPWSAETEADRKDYFIERDGHRYAGTHLIVDIWEAERLDDLAHIEATLKACVEAAGATLLHIHLHHFTPNGGVSGVAVLAESHISVHTWPERGYAAFDVFMCGDARPHAAIEVLRGAFRPARLIMDEHLRGRAP